MFLLESSFKTSFTVSFYLLHFNVSTNSSSANDTASLILSLKKVKFQLFWEYTMFFKHPEKMKWHGVKFGLLRGHAIRWPQPIYLVESYYWKNPEQSPYRGVALHLLESKFFGTSKTRLSDVLNCFSLIELFQCCTRPVSKNCLL